MEGKEKPEPKTESEETKDNHKNSNSEIAVIQIRGTVGVNHAIKDTLTMLNLVKKHNCVIVPATPHYIGMVKKVNNYITWGEVHEDTKKLLEKKTRKNNTFLLSPPKGGFERKGIKKSFQSGGVLGHRGIKINELIKKMI